MQNSLHILTICMGSSCFSRGNKKLVSIIQEFLKTRNLEDRVTLKGAHCMGFCDKGPTLQIDDKTLFHITAENLETILETHLL